MPKMHCDRIRCVTEATSVHSAGTGRASGEASKLRLCPGCARRLLIKLQAQTFFSREQIGPFVDIVAYDLTAYLVD